MKGAKTPEQIGQEGDRIVVWAAEAHRALQCRSTHVREDFIVLGKDCFRMCQELLTGCGQPHAGPAAV